MKYSLIHLGAALAFLSSTPGRAQSQPEQPSVGAMLGKSQNQQPSAIRTTVQEVVLDMVFRDKKGKPIHDIGPEEIHIYEDGTEQKLGSFRLVEGRTARPVTSSGASPASATTPIKLDPMREIRLVTLVFEGLDPDGKRFFKQAVKDLLEMAAEQNLYFSVFTIDQKLHCIQPFTADHDALMQALNRSLAWSFIQYSTQSADVKQKLEHALSGDAPQLTGGPTSGPTSQQVGDMVNYRLAKMQYDMLQEADRGDREVSARASVSSLLDLVRAESTLPGRKTILYFNPWFRIPESIDEPYKNLKSLANRGNVTFYTVDTKGLNSSSQESGGRDMLRNSAAASRSMQTRGNQQVTPDQVRAAEAAEGSIRDNPLGWLRDLAKDTGGATIGESNDWKAPLRLVMDDVRTYYEASYTPTIASFDGKFRRIAVKLDRPDVQVHTRSGYFALPMLDGGRQLFAYEMPMLNALAADRPPADVGFSAAAERFNDRGPKIEYMLTVEAPLKELVFEPHPDTKKASVNADVLVVTKDERGEIVDKFSKEFSVQVDLDKVAAYKAGNLVQTFRTELTPGSHTLEVAVMDRQGGKIGVKKTPLQVPAPSNKLSLSSVVLIRRTDAIKDTPILDAFYFEGGKIVPTLASTLKGGPGNVLPFYFVVYPDPSVKTAPELTMSFSMGGQFLGAAKAPLPPPQKDGRIPYIANIPADKFPSGDYEIKVGIAQGDQKAEQKIAFRVE